MVADTVGLFRGKIPFKIQLEKEFFAWVLYCFFRQKFKRNRSCYYANPEPLLDKGMSLI